MPPRAARCPTEWRCRRESVWWGQHAVGEERWRHTTTERGEYCRGRRGHGRDEKEVAGPMAGMTYLRNQVYVGRKSIVRAPSRAGLLSFCRPYLSSEPPPTNIPAHVCAGLCAIGIDIFASVS
ncbi:hypothetical protein KM043_017197 [Ampulex compressa]|nr:hypothetical protein KM043_017197 [Ampulex compressa]